MHLLIIAPEQIPVPPPVGGSVEHCIYQIARQISSKHKVTIISRWRPNYPKKSVLGHVTIIRVPGKNKKTYLSNVIKKIQGKHYDHIQIDNRPTFVHAVKNAFPSTRISIFLHSTTFISPPMTSKKQARIDLARADLIVGNSLSLQNHLKRNFPSIAHKVRYVHLGVDIHQFRPKSVKRSSSSRRFVILFAGRLIPRKGIPVLMRATQLVRKAIPSASLKIAGGTGKPGYKAYLKKLAASLRIPVTFSGYVSRSGMPRFYRSGDIFVCPSQGHEAFGLVNVEAMASGLPTVASRNGGIPEIIKHQRNGLLVTNYRSPKAFSKKMISFAKNRAMANRLSRQARKDVMRKFSWRATARKLVSLYQH
ncbi:glycosyltransferase family 4 protein [Paenibacillus roseipurpureus]|uniref:Glycosyltransferase family 4 protein n=1 Tax=Paenibacillus roseopurpureus TaxID=2918901 RepID=A0AA96LLD5_9BACL|nr:glycosyltransferase family 4 protein [Paenibacillus sp. MBLB1832]WNR43109.1 glycosyltransferase family 4 protein [Paenibacillus sp. MBLB1832]